MFVLTVSLAFSLCFCLTWPTTAIARETQVQEVLDANISHAATVETPSSKHASQYGVGIDLGSYGTVAVSYSNGSKVNIAKIEPDESYKRLMARLSLESSQHLHPPYYNWPDQRDDWARQRRRQWNKDHNLAASEDVETLASMISSLVNATELQLGHRVKSALAATPNLVALYPEDMIDAFEFLGLEYLGSTWSDRVYHETSAAMAGNGLGLCDDYTNTSACWAEEEKFPIKFVLSVLFTRDCLCVELAYTQSAAGTRGYRVSPPTMDFNLGLDQIHSNPGEEYYWEAIRDTILRAMVIDLSGHEPEEVFVMGEESKHPRFREVLEDSLLQFLGKLPRIYDEDPVFRAAQGVAEMAKRRRFAL